MVGLRQRTAFHEDVDQYGRPLSVQDRERLLAPILPAEPASRSKPRKHDRRVTNLFQASLYVLIFNLVQIVFSVYIRVRRAYRNVLTRILGVLYHHHRTPELIQRDVRDLAKLPKHLSMILDLSESDQDGAALESLVNDVCECAAWTACAGVPMLSIYERTGKKGTAKDTRALGLIVPSRSSQVLITTIASQDEQHHVVLLRRRQPAQAHHFSASATCASLFPSLNIIARHVRQLKASIINTASVCLGWSPHTGRSHKNTGGNESEEQACA